MAGEDGHVTAGLDWLDSGAAGPDGDLPAQLFLCRMLSRQTAKRWPADGFAAIATAEMEMAARWRLSVPRPTARPRMRS